MDAGDASEVRLGTDPLMSSGTSRRQLSNVRAEKDSIDRPGGASLWRNGIAGQSVGKTTAA